MDTLVLSFLFLLETLRKETNIFFLILGEILDIVEGEVHLSPFHLTKSDWVEILFEATKVKPQPLLVSSVGLVCINKIHTIYHLISSQGSGVDYILHKLLYESI